MSTVVEIPLTVARMGARRVELRDAQGRVLAVRECRLHADALVDQLTAQCGPGERLAVTWVGFRGR